MIYRKKQLDKFNIKFLRQKKNTLKKKIYSCFKKSYYQSFNKRISFYIKNFYKNKDLQFYNSQNKPTCFITYSTRVPSSKLLVSRFFLVKNVNKLLIGGYQR